MSGRFHKMHGLGNDFVVIDARADRLMVSPGRARAIADRRTGIGCDQLIVLEASPDADARMQIWNPDGSEAEACGNAFRAAAVLLGEAVLDTRGGRVAIGRAAAGATAELGPPSFDWAAIPLAYALDTASLPIGWDGLANPAAVNVGNPHLVFFVANQTTVDLETLGPAIEHDALFPERINVNVATITGRSSLSLRTWERGAGLTRACGTGAAATAVVAIRARLVTAPVTVAMAGGELCIDWSPGGGIRMTGPATHVYSGEIDWDQFPA